jgi:hypothetical protein
MTMRLARSSIELSAIEPPILLALWPAAKKIGQTGAAGGLWRENGATGVRGALQTMGKRDTG